ncbi:hypothetical protein BDV96DRAFT_650725 [Lophiotrema nucula]|uniref:Uncharacterized protein n=1 Tax=Lophiotrema nucula TaxID=690887 RepID=A0A6A5YWU3_9PLEO|nr:hypothetical protein BDV96DRAFT_650725 [Lophiotrema nucula]
MQAEAWIPGLLSAIERTFGADIWRVYKSILLDILRGEVKQATTEYALEKLLRAKIAAGSLHNYLANVVSPLRTGTSTEIPIILYLAADLKLNTRAMADRNCGKIVAWASTKNVQTQLSHNDQVKATPQQ